jgi:hypothetical protein
MQENNLKRYQDAEISLKEAVDKNEGTDIMIGMIKERRKWINELKAMGMVKVPEDVKGFYEKLNAENISAEEAALKKADEDEKKT